MVVGNLHFSSPSISSELFFRSSVEVYLQERGWDYRDLPNLRKAGKMIRWGKLKANLEANKFGKGAGTYHYVITLQPEHLGVGEELLTWLPADKSVREPLTLIKTQGAHLATVLIGCTMRRPLGRFSDCRPAL